MELQALKGKNPEKEIISLLLQKDTRGIGLLYDNYSTAVYSLIYKIVKDSDLSNIVLQDTFLKIWTKIESYNQYKGRFSTWVLNIAKNTAVDMVRSKHFRESGQMTSLDNLAKKRPVVEVKIDDIGIKEMVFQLDPKYYVIIELIYFNGFTYSEAADYIGIPLGTLKSRIRKAFNDLRTLIDDQENTF